MWLININPRGAPHNKALQSEKTAGYIVNFAAERERYAFGETIVKSLFAIFMMLVFSAAAYSQDQENQNLGTGNLVMIAKSICEGKTTAIPAEKWPEFCIQYHEMMASYYKSQATIHESCAKKPGMDMCRKGAGNSRIE